ncbi:signal peptidase I [Paenibacillus sp. SI8]|uniref:signal peptidase I n=1 Tax=unclassified Paenibacillus TaxID=185978 RepID=UPI0034676305
MSFFVQRNEQNKAASRRSVNDEAKSLTQELWDWTKSILVALLVVILTHQFGFNLSTVRGSSMQPTLQEGEWLIVNKAITYLMAPKRGEVVILREPEERAMPDHPYLVKRVVAIAGDEVESRSGVLYVNGAEVLEPYTDSPISDGDFGPTYVGPGHVFVMGDNRHAAASLDSRRFGSVPTGLIQGRAEFVVWPLSVAAKL